MHLTYLALLAALSSASPTHTTPDHQLAVRQPPIFFSAGWPNLNVGSRSVDYNHAQWPAHVVPETRLSGKHWIGEIPDFVTSNIPQNERARSIVAIYTVIKEATLAAEPGKVVHTTGIVVGEYQSRVGGWQSVRTKLYEGIQDKSQDKATVVAWQNIWLAESLMDVQPALAKVPPARDYPPPRSAEELQAVQSDWLAGALQLVENTAPVLDVSR